MACQVKITSVTPYGTPGQGLSSLVVTGTASECPGNGVVVEVHCGATPKTQTVAVIQGAWQATFADLSGTGCVCNDPTVQLVVTAYCKADTTCSDREVYQPILCQPYPCPTITLLDADIPTCDEVRAAGKYVVTFTAQVSGQNVGLCKWNFGDGTPPQNGPLPQIGVATIQHAYDCAGTYTVVLTILSDCEPYYTDDELIQITLPPCGCPSITIAAEPSAANPCLWNFKASLSGPFTACVHEYLWNFDDGSQPESTPVPSTSHTYAHDGEYDVTLTLIGVGAEGGGACSALKHIEVKGCRGGGGGGDDGRPCPDWNPACWKLCGWLGALLALLIGAYIVGIATGVATDISAYLLGLGIEITEQVLIGAIGGVIAAAMAAYLAFCGACNLAKAMIAGGVLGIVGIIAAAVFGAPPVPNWLGAVITALFFIAAGWLLYDRECD